MKRLLLFLFSILYYFSVHAGIRLPNALSSNMVLQQQSDTKLWGWSNPNEKIKITTSWDGKVTETRADGNATWAVTVRTPKAGGPYTITLQGENTIVLENVLIGEVWICSGQSNMEWSYNRGVDNMKEEFARLDKSRIRLLKIDKSTSKTPQDNASGTWTVCDSNSLKAFSAVGYFFGKNLNKDLDVPIGLISSSWGGTPAEVWTPAELIEADAVLKADAAKSKPNTGRPVTPGYAYNAMIAPLVNYNIAGAIWYQGEGNAEKASSYTQLMNALIGSWRKAWNKDFPFYYVQIAPYRYGLHHVGALLREAQTNSLSTAKTGMVVVSDLVADTLNIHPTNKSDVGLRLANLALAETYGLPKKGYKSPMFKSLTVKGKNAVVDLDYAEAGLMLKGDKPATLMIAGADQVFHPASVQIKRNQLIVSSKQVKEPVAVRYQFSNAGIGNLFSKAGLPVAPFRTDTWEVDTSKVK